MFEFSIKRRETPGGDEVPSERRTSRPGTARQVAVRDERGGVAGWVIAPVSPEVFGRDRGTVFMDRA